MPETNKTDNDLIVVDTTLCPKCSVPVEIRIIDQKNRAFYCEKCYRPYSLAENPRSGKMFWFNFSTNIAANILFYVIIGILFLVIIGMDTCSNILDNAREIKP